MGKATVKGFGGVFLNLINLTAVICILSLIAPCFRRGNLVPVATGIARSKSDGPITLFNATIAKVETTPHQSNRRLSANISAGQSSPTSDNRSGAAKSAGKVRQSDEWQSVRMRVTAYCPCPKCCGQYSDGITACGHKIRPGDTFVAADRRYPFGTEMLIPGYGHGRPVKVLDRGGAIKGNRLDVFFGSHEEALEWGVKYLEVRIRRK